MTADNSAQPTGTETRPVEKVRDVVVEWIETVATQGERALHALGLGNSSKSLPAPSDILETATDLLVTFDLPGVDPQALDVVLVGNMLTIKGERAGTVAATGETILRRERPIGKFERTIALPVSIDPTQVTADSHHGVVTVRLAKAVRSVAQKVQVSVR